MNSKKIKLSSVASEANIGPTLDKPTWGLLLEDVVDNLKHKQWRNSGKLKRLLKEDSAFPIEIALKAPRGNTALEDIHHFQRFVSSWKAFSEDKSRHACEVKWESRTFRSLAEQQIPTHFKILNIGALACLLGKNEEHQLNKRRLKIAYISNALAALHENTTSVEQRRDKKHAGEDSDGNSKQRALFLTLIDNLERLDKFNSSDLELLVKLIPQLKQGMAEGCYLRALPVKFVDTKFIENNLRIIESIAMALIDETIGEMGLLSWLHCRQKPKDWLLVKPLCEQTIKALGGIPLLRLSSDTLLDFELPARNILVVENEQPCLSLGNVPDTISISGGGKNVAWMNAKWLRNKRVGYWGDIDSEGLGILSDARSKLSTLAPLMMDIATVEAYQERIVAEPDSVSKEPIALTGEESALFKVLRSKKYNGARLEQERLPLDYVMQNIASWIE